MNRRSFIKKLLGSVITVSVLSGGSYYYAREIEPSMLKITDYTIQSPKIPSTFNNFKIIQFSDTHVGFHYSLSDLRKLVENINENNPDLIVFTGDLIDDPNSFTQLNELSHVLSLLKAPYGKFWIYGNHDHGGYGTEVVHRVMENGQFKLLKNNHHIIQKNNKHIVLAGIDDVILGRPDVQQAIDQADDNLFTILLAHEPDYADVASQFSIDIQLSGHSHGGQVRFPFLGHLYTPVFAQKYIYGEYQLNDQFTLFVNRGIGTTRLPLRFLCTPEVSNYTLKSL